MEDQVYEIANAIATENTYMGKTTTRITINESTKVSLREDDDPSVPDVSEICKTVKELTEVPIG